MSVESPPARARSRRPAPDAACLAAVDVARDAAVLAAGDADRVGDHLGFEVDADRVLTHFFTCLAAGYPGWHWAVTLVRASRARVVTVDEVVLLPGDLALLAPPWLPWNERLRPGDLGPTDLLPAPPGDPRLDPGYTAAPSDVTVEPAADHVEDRSADPAGAPVGTADSPATLADALGLGRARVLSPFGRDDAADRWAEGPSGPGSDVAVAAPAHCSTCGFFVPLAGPLRAAFGVCANAMSPLDARVVSLDSGCGAHSEGGATGAETYRSATATSEPVLDDVVLADFSLRSDAPRSAARPAVPEPGTALPEPETALPEPETAVADAVVTEIERPDAPVADETDPDAPVADETDSDAPVVDETDSDAPVVDETDSDAPVADETNSDAPATGTDEGPIEVQVLDAPVLDAFVAAVLEAAADGGLTVDDPAEVEPGGDPEVGISPEE